MFCTVVIKYAVTYINRIGSRTTQTLTRRHSTSWCSFTNFLNETQHRPSVSEKKNSFTLHTFFIRIRHVFQNQLPFLDVLVKKSVDVEIEELDPILCIENLIDILKLLHTTNLYSVVRTITIRVKNFFTANI